MPPPQFALNASLADLGDAWLALTCCKGVTYVPVRLLAGAAHPKDRLGDVIRRMRCKDCHDRPAKVALDENPAAMGDGGPPAGWVLQLS